MIAGGFRVIVHSAISARPIVVAVTVEERIN
jgi:hypothetical protein